MIFKQIEPKKSSLNSMMEELRIAKLREKLIEHDNAFLNSFLSHTVYTGRQWALGLIKNHPDQTSGKFTAKTKLEAIVKEFEADMTTKKAYEIYMSTYLRARFEMVDLPIQSGEYKSKDFGYKTQINYNNGDYEALNNLARAGIFRSSNRDGTYTLHVAFRGTDTLARSFFDFARLAYTDVAAYSDCFKPLEKALIEYVNNPENKIKNVHLSGHSLGGAPAQIMMHSLKNNAEFKNANVDLKTYTYGAIGGFSYIWNKVITTFYHAATKGNFNQFKTLGVTALRSLNLIKSPSDENVYRYKHASDLIPIVGGLGYDNRGTVCDLKDFSAGNAQMEISVGGKAMVCSKTTEYDNMSFLEKTKITLIDNPIHYVKKTFTLGYHDMLRYVRNIDCHVKDLSLGSPELDMETLTPNIEEFKLYTKRYDKVVNSVHNRISRNMFNSIAAPEAKPIKIDSKSELSKVLNKIHSIRIANSVMNDLSNEFTPMKPKMG